tara:strand:- start:80 stop:319 length:240 start_codon:yes stop_codon:yes gene_type:complete
MEVKNIHEKKKQIIHPEDAQIIADQKELGAIMDIAAKKEQFLARHKDVFLNDDSLLLYRLPLNESQMEQIYLNLIKEST